MNVYDSARMADVLAPLGYVLTDDAGDADMVVLNTCHIREKASEKVYSELGRLRVLKAAREKTGGRMIIAVAGCVAQAEGEEIISRAPFVDMVFGPQTYHNLADMVARVGRGAGAVLETDFPPEPKFDHLPEPVHRNGFSAFLTVQEGCDRFCSFCVVPYTRGNEYSRPPGDIAAEAGRMAAAGVREITLLGQNVNAYHGRSEDGSEWGLGRLISELAEIEGLSRIRYTTSYPADMDQELIAAHRDVPRLMPFLHLPVQSGSDSVLAAMNRRHTADEYRRLVDRLKRARPDLALSSDFIVGFPGESDRDFQATMDLARDIGCIQAYSFKYSPRPGTPAAVLDGHIADGVKTERLAALQELLNEQQETFNQSCVGRSMAVLLDRPGRYPGQLVGRSPYMQPVHVENAGGLLGSMVDLKITAGHANSLSGAVSPARKGEPEDIATERACA